MHRRRTLISSQKIGGFRAENNGHEQTAAVLRAAIGKENARSDMALALADNATDILDARSKAAQAMQDYMAALGPKADFKTAAAAILRHALLKESAPLAEPVCSMAA